MSCFIWRIIDGFQTNSKEKSITKILNDESHKTHTHLTPHHNVHKLL